MSLLNVVNFPNKALTTKAKEITVFDSKLKDLANNMLETMYKEEGIGLAANQVAVLKRIFVIDLNSGSEESELTPMIFINPKIVEKSGSISIGEGCLSVPDATVYVPRAEQITVEYQDLNGNLQTLKADKLLSICIQHELDHLNGKLLIDYLPRKERRAEKKKLSNLQNRKLNKVAA